MSRQKSLTKKTIAILLMILMIASTLLASAIPALAEEDHNHYEDDIAEPPVDVSYGTAVPAAKAVGAQSMGLQSTGAPVGVNPTATPVDPLNLSAWTVYDNYYNPNWTGAWNGSVEITPKPTWTENTAAGGFHPFFAWKESSATSGTNTNDKFYDLSTAADKARMKAEVFDVATTAPSFEGNKKDAVVAHFSQHIYTDGTAASPKMIFLGYGRNNMTDFALAPIDSDGMKSVNFDIDASAVNAHTMNSFGIIFNAGIGSSGTSAGILRGYALQFKMASTTAGVTNGTVYLVDYSDEGINATDLHRKYAINYTSTTEPGYGNSAPQSLFTFAINRSAIGKIRVDLDMEATKLVVKVRYYDAAGKVPDQPLASDTKTITLATDTGLNAYGPFVDYVGAAAVTGNGLNNGHGCERLSYVKFENFIPSNSNYKVTFDPNCDDFTQGPDPSSIDGIEPGNSLADHQHSLPSIPTRPNHVFVKWTMDAEGKDDEFTTATKISQNTTVFAQWIKDIYITFVPDDTTDHLTEKGTSKKDPNGDVTIIIPVDQDGNAQNPIGKGNVPDVTPLPDYEFTDTWTNEDGSQTWTTEELEKLTPDEPMLLKPVNKRLYTVTYAVDSNGTLSGNTSEKVRDGNSPLNVPAPSAKDTTVYRFKGWTRTGDPAGTYYTEAQIKAHKIEKDTTYTAVFEPIPSGVNYETSTGGSLSGQASYPNVPTGASLSIVARAPDPVPNNGYEFDKWVDSNGNDIDPATAVVGPNTGTITAKFKPLNKYTVEFKVRGSGTLTGPTTFSKFKPTSMTGNFKVSEMESYAQPGKSPSTGHVFYRWEDEQGNEILDPDAYELKNSSTVIYARFEEDKDDDKYPDIIQPIITVKFEMKNATQGTVSTPNTFSIRQRLDNKPTYLKNALPVGTPVFATLPTVTPRANLAFDTWQDPNGTDNADPANTDLNIYNQSKVDTTLVFKAVVDTDENDDKIPDKYQWEYTLTFHADATKFVFSNMSGSSKVYRFLGGDNRVSSVAPTLGLSNLIGGSSSYVVPTVNKKPGNTEFEPGNWGYTSGTNISNLNDPKLTADTVYSMGEIPKTYTVKFMVNGSQHDIVTGITNSQTVSQVKSVSIPANNGAKVFEYWVGSDGKSYTHAQAMAYQPNRDMVFTAMFRTVGIIIKL